MRLGTSLVQRAGGTEVVRYVSVREYARMLGVSRATVYKAVAAGLIPHIRVSSAIRIPLRVQ
jgi:excisionase family DNA binding protein